MGVSQSCHCDGVVSRSGKHPHARGPHGGFRVIQQGAHSAALLGLEELVEHLEGGDSHHVAAVPERIERRESQPSRMIRRDHPA